MTPPTRHDSSTPHASIPALVAGFASIYIIWGSTYIAIKFAVETLPPYLMAGTRFLTAGALLWIALALRGAAPRPTWRQFRAAAFIGMILLAGSNGFVTWSEQWAPSAIAALIIGTVPLWMVLLDWMLNRRSTPSLHVFLGLAVGFSGVALLTSQNMQGEQAVAVWPIAGLLFACVLWAYGSLRSRRVDQGASLMVASAMQMVGGGACMIVLGTIFGEWGRVDIDAVTAKSVLSWSYLIVFGSLIGFTSYVWLLRHASPTAVSTYAYVNPIVAVFLGWSLGNEPITAMTLLAGTMIVGAVVLMTRRSRALPAPKPGAAAPCEIPEEEVVAQEAIAEPAGAPAVPARR
jgi:drug/metabolite transporter (DMT)-like permease